MNEEFRGYLEALDVAGARRFWAHHAPNMPQPKTDTDALVSLHMARTQSQSIGQDLRFYSHRWLLDHGYPSQLPDWMKPSAERMYPRTSEAVGISVNYSAEIMKPAKPIIEAAISDAVAGMYADRNTDPLAVRKRMMDVKRDEEKRLFGAIASKIKH